MGFHQTVDPGQSQRSFEIEEKRKHLTKGHFGDFRRSGKRSVSKQNLGLLKSGIFAIIKQLLCILKIPLIKF